LPDFQAAHPQSSLSLLLMTIGESYFRSGTRERAAL
jgi:hypothetical protein